LTHTWVGLTHTWVAAAPTAAARGCVWASYCCRVTAPAVPASATCNTHNQWGFQSGFSLGPKVQSNGVSYWSRDSFEFKGRRTMAARSAACDASSHGCFFAAAALCSTATSVSKLDGRKRSLVGRLCCAPSQNCDHRPPACSKAAVITHRVALKGLCTSRVSAPGALSISYGHVGCLKARAFPPPV
jgi:hypothetical protein